MNSRLLRINRFSLVRHTQAMYGSKANHVRIYPSSKSFKLHSSTWEKMYKS